MNSDKTRDGHLLDELLGIDPNAFEEDERTKVYPKSDPPPADPSEPHLEAAIPAAPRPASFRPPPPSARREAAAEDEAPTGVPPGVVAPPAPAPAAAKAAPARVPRPARPSERPQPSVPPPAVAAAPVRAESPAPLPVEPVTVIAAAAPTPAALLPADTLDLTAAAEQLDDASRPDNPPAVQVTPEAVVASQPGRDPMIDEVIDGRYRIQRILGVGGIGIVYLCKHEVLEKPVAMKVLRREYVLHEDLIERFLNEARASSAIKSPRIVDTIDVGTLPDGTPYFVMEYVDGETLAALLDREGAVDLPRAVEITKQIAEGLDAAHAAGVIHRDLKPENVFLAPGEGGVPFVKIFDFGIAKVARARKRLTYAGAVFGTPHYMSPEQARGEEVDQRSDVYALGVMLFETITGKVPFDGDDPLAVMSQHVDRAPPLMSSMMSAPIPASLEAVVSRCLAKDMRDRYASANELLADLNGLDPAELAGSGLPLSTDSQQPWLPQASQPTPTRLAALTASSRPETLHAHEVPRGEPPAKKRYMLLGGAVATAAAFAAVIWAATREVEPPVARAPAAERTVAPRATPPIAPTDSTPTAREAVKVDFVLSPIDARLYRGEEDLGPMPVSVQIEPGSSPVTLTVRRKGYTTRKLVVDGSETRVVVGLLKADPPVNQAANRSYVVKKRNNTNNK